MNSILAIATLLLAFIDAVKACNTPIVAQRGPRGPPGVPGNIGLPANDLILPVVNSVPAGRKRSIQQFNYVLIHFPIEEDNLGEAKKAVRETMTNLYEKIEKKPDLPSINDFHSRFRYINQQLTAQMEIKVKNQKQCENLKETFESARDEKITISCI